MAGVFKVAVTPGFERDVRQLLKKIPEVLPQVKKLVAALENDPYNRSRAHDIKKLLGVMPGAGQFRIRSGNFRLRYDIFGNEVLLHSIRDRKEAY